MIQIDLMGHIGSQLKMMRRMRKVSAAKMAEDLGKTRQCLSYIEKNGDTSTKNIKLYVEYLNDMVK